MSVWENPRRLPHSPILVDGVGQTVKVWDGPVAEYPKNPVWATAGVQESEYGACTCSLRGKVKHPGTGRGGCGWSRLTTRDGE